MSTASWVSKMPGGQGAEKRAYVDKLFTEIAPRYDRFNRLASLCLDQGWRRRAIRESGLRPGMLALDVCTGTGDLALMCAASTGASGLVVGLDFNDAMLRSARPKGDGRVAWMRGDALSMPFGSGRFDRIYIGFSTRNLADLEAGLREMLRVLKPGGRLAILETGRPSNPVIRAGYFLFLGTVVRAIGLLVTGRLWPFTYLARSVKAFLPPPAFVALLTRCGATARHIPLAGGLASLYIAEKPR